MPRHLIFLFAIVFASPSFAEERIVYTSPDGGVSVVAPAFSAMQPGETRAAFMDRVKKTAVPADAVSVEILDHTEIPQDREFRDAWERRNGAFVTNIEKARAVQERRIAAAKRAAARDVLERETAGENVAAEKSALATIDPRAAVSGLKTIDAIRAAWPKALRKP